jgi:hypothetical protein
VHKLELLQWQLQGVPLSCAAVPGGSSYVVGDDRAGEADGRSCAMHACLPERSRVLQSRYCCAAVLLVLDTKQGRLLPASAVGAEAASGAGA